MVQVFNLQTSSSLLAALFTFTIALLTLIRSQRSEEAKAFVVICILLSVWTSFPFVTNLIGDPTLRTGSGRLAYLAASLVPASFAWLIRAVLASSSRRIHRMLPIFWVFSFGFVLASISPLFIRDVARIGGLMVVHGGVLYHLFVGYFVLACAYTFIEMILALRASRGHKHNQLTYYLTGFLFAYLAGTLHFVAMYLNAEPIPHDIFVIAFITVLAYAIVKHRLMEVHLAARYSAVQTLLGVFVGVPVVAFVLLINQPILTGGVILLLVLFGQTLFRGIRSSLTDAVDRLPIFRGRYERFTSLQTHLQTISRARSVEEWAETVVHVSETLYKPLQIMMLVRDEPRKRFLIRSAVGVDAAKAVFASLSMTGALVRFLQRERNVLIAETAAGVVPPEDRREVLNDLSFLGAALCVPMVHNDSLYGILVLGEKAAGGIYNDLELASLGALARDAEHSLRVVLSGLAQVQTTAVWAHDLVKPFGLKGTFSMLTEIAEGVFGPVNEDMKSALSMMAGDINFVRQNLERVIRPGQGEVYNILPRPVTGVFMRHHERYALEAIKSGIEWKVDVPPENIRVFCDWMLIEHRVLSNLIENAFRYTPKGGKVDVGYRVEGNRFIAHVRDTGLGIREKDLANIFEAGVQGQDGEKGIAGLGLFSAKMVVEAQKGKIWVESVFGKGTTFYFDLPLASMNGSSIT